MAPTRSRTATTLLAALLGGALGLAVGAGLYLLGSRLVEGRGGWVEELQGLLWNVVPLGALVGVLLGYVVADRRSPHGRS